MDGFFNEHDEYTVFLKRDALDFQEMGVSSTHILWHTVEKGILAYMTLSTDAIMLTKDEKDVSSLGDIPFSTIPALKIGKLAVDINFKQKYSHIGSLMIDYARGFAFEVNDIGVACRFLTIDADIVNNPTVMKFYRINGFESNEKYKNRKQAISMRKDIFYP